MSLRAVAVALGCMTLAHQASDARADSIEDFGPRRQLAGHVFFPSRIVADPFLSTHVEIFTAGGYEWTEGPNFDALGNLTGEIHFRAAAIVQGASFQASVTDYLAIRIAGAGGLDGGNNARSALVVGAIRALSAGAGATVSHRFRRDLRLGITGDFIYANDKLVQPLDAIKESIAAGDVVASAALETLNTYSVLPGITGAYAPTDAIGLLASVQYDYTRQTDGESRNRQYVALGASAQVDLLPIVMVPIGFIGSYRATIPFEDDVRVTQTVEAGVFYTGRKDLDLGIEAQVKWLDLRPDHRFRLDSTELIGLVELRYHWN